MKRIVYVSLVSVLLIACTKYENGPDYTLQTKKVRLANNWTVNEAIHLNGDSTAPFHKIYSGYQFNIGADEQYSLFFRPNGEGHYNEKGTWKFSDDKLHFITTSEAGAVIDYYILRLAHNELWVRFTNEGNEWELHLFPKPI